MKYFKYTCPAGTTSSNIPRSAETGEVYYHEASGEADYYVMEYNGNDSIVLDTIENDSLFAEITEAEYQDYKDACIKK